MVQNSYIYIFAHRLLFHASLCVHRSHCLVSELWMKYPSVLSEPSVNWPAETLIQKIPLDAVLVSARAISHHYVIEPSTSCQSSASRGPPHNTRPKHQPAEVHAECSDQVPVEAPVRLAVLPTGWCSRPRTSRLSHHNYISNGFGDHQNKAREQLLLECQWMFARLQHYVHQLLHL